jgi:hypothetical protein
MCQEQLINLTRTKQSVYRVGERWVENVVKIDRQQVEEALTTGLDKEDQTLVTLVRSYRDEQEIDDETNNNTYDFNGVAGVVDVSPGIYHRIKKKE